MNKLVSAWSALDPMKKAVVVLAAVALVVGVAMLGRLAAVERMALLYAGLDAAAAGEVVSALEARGVPVEVRGASIYVPESARDATRLALAAEGLPANGGVGYELLDNMTGFGTTAQMFDAAYMRAKEGELARTILASPGIRAARVHIAAPPSQPFSRDVPASASVTVTPAAAPVTEAQARAMRFLVASAVAGLAPDAVAVIDSANGVVLAGEGEGPARPDAAIDPRAETLRKNIERLLAARVGPGNVRVEVFIAADMDSQRVTERVIDPASRTAISSDLQEISEQSSGGPGGDVTVASNLPGGDAEGEAAGSSSNRSETRERQNFEVSETTRERVIQPGQIRRISVAVLVDGITAPGPDGEPVWSPRPAEELASLRTLVEGAMGYDPARGDSISLETLEFPAAPAAGVAAVPTPWFTGGTVLGLIQTLVLGLVVLALGLFVVRPLLMRRPALEGHEGIGETIDLTPDEMDEAETDGQPQHGAAAARDADKIRNLRSLVQERRDESGDVLRRWIEASDPAEERA